MGSSCITFGRPRGSSAADTFGGYDKGESDVLWHGDCSAGVLPLKKLRDVTKGYVCPEKLIRVYKQRYRFLLVISNKLAGDQFSGALLSS